MRIHCIIHAAFESPGVISHWAKQKKFILSMTHTYRDESLPKVDEFDFLIVLGGPQSALNLDQWPYLRDEIILIQETMDTHKPLLGICLGAQLIAESLEAKAERSPFREIGLFPITLLPSAIKDPIFSKFPGTFSVLHWHNDMPGLPKEARLLAQSEGCPRQAFAIGDRIYALQFHLEMTQKSIAEMLPHCENELTPDKYVESKQNLLRHDLKDMNRKMFVLLDELASKI